MKLKHSFEAIASISDQALVSGGNFLLIVIASKYLSIEQLGELGYIVAIYIATVLFNTASIFQDLSVEYPKYLNKKGLFVTALKAQTVLAAIQSLLLTIFYLLIETENHNNFHIFLLVAAFLIMQQLADFIRKSSYIFFNAKLAVLTSVLMYPLRIGLIYFLEPSSLDQIIIILIFSGLFTITILLYQWCKLKKINSESSVEYNYLKHLDRVKWLILSIPFMWLWSYLPVFMLGRYVDLKSVGIFIALRNITSVGNVFMEVMDTKLAAVLGRLHHQDVGEFIKNISYTKIAGLIIWAFFLLLFINFSYFILDKIYDHRFSAYSNLLPLLWVVQIFVFGVKLSGIQVRTEGKTRRIIFFPYLIGSLLNAVFGYFLIKNYAIIGAVITLIISSSVIHLSTSMLKNKVREYSG